MGTQAEFEIVNTPCGLWSQLDTQRRDEIVGALAKDYQEKGFDRALAKEIAARLKFRPNMVRRARGPQVHRLISKVIALGHGDMAASALVRFCFVERTDELSAIYDALGVEHDGLDVDDLAAAAPLSEEAVDAALNLADDDDSEETAFCLQVLNLQCFRPWQPIVRRIVEELASRGGLYQQASAPDLPDHECATALSAEDESTAAGVTARDEAPETGPDLNFPQLTTLDRVLIRAVIATLNRVEGALDIDQLDDLVQETLEMNDARYQSYYHRGFLDSLTDRPCQNRGPGENAERRAWYLVGFCQGLMRRSDAAAGATFIKELPVKDRQALLNPPVDAGAFFVPTIVRPLLDARHFSEAADWISIYLPRAAERVLPKIIGWARLALLESDPGQVGQILELCFQTVSKMPGGHEARIAPLVNQMERRLAIAMRLQGKPTRAETIVDRLLLKMTDDNARSKLLGDKLLIQMGMRSLADLRIQKVETREALGATFERVAAALRDAIGNVDQPSTTANLAAAIQVVLSDTDDAETIKPAILCLNRALRAMEMKNAQFWDDKGILPRARFYLSVLELRLLDPAVGAPAATRLINLLEDGLKEPLDLVVDAVNHAVVQELPDADRLARIALGSWPQAVLAQLDLTGLVRRSTAFRTQIVDALEGNAGRLTSDERWTAWNSVRKGALLADERDIEIAQRALDEMETLAEVHGFDEGFTDLLRDQQNWEPAWTPLEADTARFRLLEARGKLVDARAALVNIAHSAIGERASDADELIETLKLLGAEEDTLSDLRYRIAASTQAEDVEEDHQSESDVPVSVLFVGGDERQQPYAQKIVETLAISHPGCEVRFEIPSWSSNWGREMDKYIQAMERSGAVVLMRFIRTTLGRHLRKAANETNTPWIPCTGHGYNSMLRAVKKAIYVARQNAD